jgi:hypothetical protein
MPNVALTLLVRVADKIRCLDIILARRLISSSSSCIISSCRSAPHPCKLAVQIHNQYPEGHPIRREANKIVHSEDPGKVNQYTSNYQHSTLVQKFIDKHL